MKNMEQVLPLICPHKSTINAQTVTHIPIPLRKVETFFMISLCERAHSIFQSYQLKRGTQKRKEVMSLLSPHN